MKKTANVLKRTPIIPSQLTQKERELKFAFQTLCSKDLKNILNVKF